MDKTVYLNSVARLCIKQLKELNIPISENITFSVNTRAKKRFGRTSKYYNEYKIDIASELVDPKYIVGLKNTVMHELIHTVHGCMNHGAVWRAYANKVGNCLDIQISRTSTRTSKGLPPQTNKYNFVCQECGEVFYYHRKPKWYDRINTVNCSCGGNIKEI